MGPLNGLCIHSLLTSLFLSSFSKLALSLYLDLCPGTHWGRICTECALSFLNGYILVSAGSFERKLDRGGTLLAIRGIWFPLLLATGTLWRWPRAELQQTSLSLSWLPVRHSVFTAEQQTVSLQPLSKDCFCLNGHVAPLLVTLWKLWTSSKMGTRVAVCYWD